MDDITLMHGDCFEQMEKIADGSVALVLADPPYNIGVETERNGRRKANAWDKIDDYPIFMRRFFKASARVLKDNGHEAIRCGHEDLRCGHEDLRPTHINDAAHCNVWERAPIPSQKRFHTCEKPVDILSRIIRVSSRPGDIVLDPFMGSGSTGIACLQEGRRFIGIEKEQKYFDVAKERIAEM